MLGGVDCNSPPSTVLRLAMISPKVAGLGQWLFVSTDLAGSSVLA
jgi:hypothetical protein